MILSLNVSWNTVRMTKCGQCFFAYVWVQNFLSEGNCASMDPGNFLNVVL